MKSTKGSERLALALAGTLAVMVVPLAVSVPAWADTPADMSVGAAPVQLDDGQLKQIGDVATAHSALGVADSGAVLSLPASTSATDLAEVEGQLPAGTHTAVRISRFSKGELDQIQNAVMERKWNSEADKYGVSASYDPELDKVVLATDAPASVTDSLRSTYPGAVEVAQARLEPQVGRFFDAQAFFGGLALTNGAGGCTAGFAVKDRLTGNRYMTTANHCYSNMTHVYNRRVDGSNGAWAGQVNRRSWMIDTELLYAGSGSTYGSGLWIGGDSTSRAAAFVHGTEQPALGRKVCVSGSVSFNHCGHKISQLNFNICYSDGSCIKDGKGFVYDEGGTNWPNFDNGKITMGGDSGAPIYSRDDTESAAWIVGGHSGIQWRNDNGPCHCAKPHMIGVSVGAITHDLGVDVITR